MGALWAEEFQRLGVQSLRVSECRGVSFGGFGFRGLRARVSRVTPSKGADSV